MSTDSDIISWLKRVPPVQVSRDLTPDILAKVKAAPASPFLFHSLSAARLAAAAALVLLLGGLCWMVQRPQTSDDMTIAWLCKTQEPDGSWSTGRWGGDPCFEVALTALSLITLLEQPRSARTDVAVDGAIAYLLRSQQPDGRFGPSFSSSPYNQGIATLALAKACGVRPGGALHPALDRAVTLIRSSQYADGGWGYQQEAHPASNLSITLWQIEALRMASVQGRDGLQPVVARGLHWMAGVAADDGSFGYQKSGDRTGGASQTLTAMGAMSLLDAAHADLMSPGRRQAL